MIEPGQPAPDFELRDQDGSKVTLEDLKGHTTLLVFYPLDFSPVCTDQLSVYEQVVGEIERNEGKLIGISVDSAFTHKAFQTQLDVTIPLLADFHPKGEVARAYGVFNEERGTARRALVIVGPDGDVLWSYEAPSPLEIPGTELILEALEGQRV
jgi:peroxiredoxin